MKTIGLILANYNRDQFAELTKNRTLASLPFGGRYRLIDFVLSNMVNSGITKVGIISPYNSGSLIDHIGVGKQWNLDRKHDGLFIMPGSVFGMQTEGSKFLFKDIIDNKAFVERSRNAEYVIIAGSTDVYNFDFNKLIEKHCESGNKITVMYKHVCDAEEHWGYALDIDKNDRVCALNEEASGEADFFMDCLIINRDFLLNLMKWYAPLEYMDIMDVIRLNMDNISVGAYEFTGYLGSINSMKDYLKASRDMFDYDIRKELFQGDNTIYTKVQDDAPVLYSPEAKVTSSIIATGCRVAGNVEGSIVFRSTKIGHDAVIKNSVVMMYSEIGEGAVLENVICDKFVKVSPGVKLIGSPEKPIVLTKGTHI